MKKLFFLVALPCLLSNTALFAQTSLFAGYAVQDTELLSADHGIILGLEHHIHKHVAFSLNGTYFANNSNYTYEILRGDQKVWEANLNMNLYLTPGGKLRPYLLAGVNFSKTRLAPINSEINKTFRTSQFGVNLGAGATFQLSERLLPFAEFRYKTTSEVNGPGAAVGVKFRL